MYSLLALMPILYGCNCVTINYEHNSDIVTKSKIELSPILITSGLDDIAILSAPLVNCQEVKYYLHQPNGETTKLHITRKADSKKNQTLLNKRAIVKYINKNVKAVYPLKKYELINVNIGYLQSADSHILDEMEKGLDENDFMIGPFTEQDHGNWVLSVYCKDIDDSWIEIYQVITINIVETVPMLPGTFTRVKEGSTFNLSFVHTIKGLETCELGAPRSTFDRYFDRNRIDLDRCGYVVTNLTKQDQGIWTVTGVGKIIYKGVVFLRISDK